MSDIILESIRAAILLYMVFYLVKAGNKRKELSRKGWGFIVAGFGLLLFANVMDITDNFESLNRFIVIGDTPTQAFLEKMVGFLGGFALLAIGLIRWLPTITGVEHDKQINKELKNEVAERKRAEEELLNAKERTETILHSIQNGVLAIDAETHGIIEANPAALAMIGADLEEVVGRVCHEFVCPRQQGACPITDRGESVDNRETVLLKADGGQVDILKSVVPITLDGRECLLETFIDITERKRAQEELQRTLADTERMNRLMSGREDRVLELKDEVNVLLSELGREAKYGRTDT